MTKEEPSPSSKSKKIIFRNRARIKRAKLNNLNIPDTSISFFEDIGLYRDKPAKPNYPKKSSRYRSRRKPQFSK